MIRAFVAATRGEKLNVKVPTGCENIKDLRGSKPSSESKSTRPAFAIECRYHPVGFVCRSTGPKSGNPTFAEGYIYD